MDYINNNYLVVMNDEVEPECKLTAGLLLWVENNNDILKVGNLNKNITNLYTFNILWRF